MGGLVPHRPNVEFNVCISDCDDVDSILPPLSLLAPNIKDISLGVWRDEDRTNWEALELVANVALTA